MQFVVAVSLAVSIAACSPIARVAPEAADAAQAPVRMDWSKDPSELAIERWAAVRGAVSADCADYARSIRFEWVEDATKLNAACGLGYAVVGCFTTDAQHEPVALIRGDALANTLVHEAMHALEACQRHTIDNAHTDAALWAGLMSGDVM